MAEKSARLKNVDVTLKTFKTNLLVFKEIGADVRIIPRDSRLRLLWHVANGFQLPAFIGRANAEKELRRRLGEPSIDITARYFGTPEGVSDQVEFETTPHEKSCKSFFCRVHHRAVGLLVTIKEAGGASVTGAPKLEIKRVTARAHIRLGDEIINLAVNQRFGRPNRVCFPSLASGA